MLTDILLIFNFGVELITLYYLYNISKVPKRRWTPVAPIMQERDIEALARALAERMWPSQPYPDTPTQFIQAEQQPTSPLRQRAEERLQSYKESKAWGMDTSEWRAIQEAKIDASTPTIKRRTLRLEPYPEMRGPITLL